MKINILLLTVLLGMAQLLSAQAPTITSTNYEPARNTVSVSFVNGYKTNEQTTAEGNRMVVAYEYDFKYNLSITALYPLSPSDDMGADMEGTFNKLIADKANYVRDNTNAELSYNMQSISGMGLATSFVINDYTYAYRVMVVDNVFYLLSASSLTADSNNPDIVAFFNSFALHNND